MFIIRKILQSHILLHKCFLFVIAVFLFTGCTYNILFWERNIWTEFDGLFVIEEPDNLNKYEELLPEMFDM
ncbi:MAG: hypothetical protein WBM85_00840, partial [Eudoraea sp.]